MKELQIPEEFTYESYLEGLTPYEREVQLWLDKQPMSPSAAEADAEFAENGHPPIKLYTLDEWLARQKEREAEGYTATTAGDWSAEDQADGGTVYRHTNGYSVRFGRFADRTGLTAYVLQNMASRYQWMTDKDFRDLVILMSGR